ncbi:MAG: efflux RND transporter periplasmic adaptor subunit [Gammaproteobacteria bacterium]
MHQSFFAPLVCAIMTVAVGSTTLADEFDAHTLNCVILPDEVVDISSSVPGVLEQVLVERSDKIQKGQVLARLEASVEQAVTALAEARATAISELRLRQTELGYDVQHRDRLSELQQRHVASSQSYEDAQRTAEAARWRLKLAEERREEAQLDQRRVAALLAQKTIRSPIDGVVIARHHSVGEHVNSEAVVTVARLDPLRVEVLTPIDMFGKIQPGMLMDVRAEIDPQTRHTAEVVAVDPVADAGSGMFAVELTLPNPNNALPAGIKCYSELSPGEQPSPTAAPASTVADAPNPVTPSPTPVITANFDASELCRVFPAVTEPESISRLMRTAVVLGGRAQKIRADVAVANGYIVASPRADAAQLEQWQETLGAAGENDTAVMQRGDFRQRLTMGTYNGPRSAERRRDQIAALGVSAEVLPRMRSATAWKIEVQLPQPLPAPTGTPPLAAFMERFNSEAVPCASIRAASL